MTCLVYIDRRESAREYLLDLGADECVLDEILSAVFEGEMSPVDAATKLGVAEHNACSAWTVCDAIQDAAS